MLWTQDDGSILVDAEGNLIDCDDCPCGGQIVVCCFDLSMGGPDLHAAIQGHTFGWQDNFGAAGPNAWTDMVFDTFTAVWSGGDDGDGGDLIVDLDDGMGGTWLDPNYSSGFTSHYKCNDPDLNNLPSMELDFPGSIFSDAWSVKANPYFQQCSPFLEKYGMTIPPAGAMPSPFYTRMVAIYGTSFEVWVTRADGL